MLTTASEEKEVKQRALDEGKEVVLSIGGFYAISYDMAERDEAIERERKEMYEVGENSLTVRVFTEDDDKPDPRGDVRRPRKFQMVRVMGRVRGDIYLVACYDYITGVPTHMRMVWLSGMIEWSFFADADEWRAYADKEKKRNDAPSNTFA